MARGRVVPPNLDDRTWRDIVDEARALIPSYTPEWTDHNPSDPGITLIELFGWMVEGMIYRLNRVPERNYIEFLNLLGITRDPPAPATVQLTYRAIPSSPPLLVPRGSQASTQQTEQDAPVVFETDADLRVLPLNLVAAVQIWQDGTVTKYRDVSRQLAVAPQQGLAVDIPASGSVTIALGFDQASAETLALLVRLFKPLQRNDAQLTWIYSKTGLQPAAWTAIPTTITDGTQNLQQSGVVSLAVPGDWAQQNPTQWTATVEGQPLSQPLFWLGMRISNLLTTPIQAGLERTLFNSVAATNALTIAAPELLGTSTGKPFQVFELRNAPLYKQPSSADPYAHLVIRVRERQGESYGPWVIWTPVREFPYGAGLFYRVDPVAGTITFGNSISASSGGNGLIPPTGSEIQALSYRYVVGGGAGNVAAGSLAVMRTPITGIVGVTNHGAATGGLDEEDVEQTKARAPELLRNRYRAVTDADYEYLAREATPAVRKARALAARLATQYDLPSGMSLGDPFTFGGLNRSTGNVHVIIVPDAPLSNPAPTPSPELVQEVAAYLAERRTIGTNLIVTGPRYLPINVQTDIRVWRKAIEQRLTTLADIRRITLDKIAAFLHPLYGGLDGTGWEVGQEVTIANLLEYIQPDPAIGFIASLTIQPGTPLYQPPTRPFVSSGGVWVQLADYETVCNGTHTVNTAQQA